MDIKEYSDPYYSIIQNMSEALCSVNADTFEILYINPAAEELYGLTFDEMKKDAIGKGSTSCVCKRFIHPEDMQKVELFLTKVFENDFNVCDYRIIKADSSIRWVQDRAKAIHDKFGKIIRIDCLITDITERKNMELLQKQLFQSAKLASIGTLSAGVAHELKNPLTVISGFAQELIRRYDKGIIAESICREMLQKILKHSEKMTDIINNIRQFSRDSDSKLDSPVDVRKLIGDSVIIYKKEFENKSIELNISIADDVPNIWGNIVKLETLIRNMLSNAKDAFDHFAPSAGNKKIDVMATYDKEKEGLLLEIRDNGKGISKENLTQIFDPFFTTKEIGKGTGIGLSISYGIVTDYKGCIEVDSDVGTGTVFFINIPVDFRKRG